MADATTSIMPEALTATAWDVVPQGMFSRHYDLVRGGAIVASLRMALVHEACEFAIGGHEFAICRESMWKDSFQVVCDGQPVCQAKRRFWSSRFEMMAIDQAWTLTRAGWLSRGHRLLAGEREVGTIQPGGWFSRRRIAQFSDEVPPPVQVLAIFLVLIVGRRHQHSGT